MPQSQIIGLESLSGVGVAGSPHPILHMAAAWSTRIQFVNFCAFLWFKACLTPESPSWWRMAPSFEANVSVCSNLVFSTTKNTKKLFLLIKGSVRSPTIYWET